MLPSSLFEPASVKTHPVTHHARTTQIARLRLVVTSGRDRGRTCEPEDTELSVGTAPGNSLVLTDLAVSRHHFAISFLNRSPRIRDLGSTNGTRVDGTQIFDASLHAGATITLGDTTLLVHDAGVTTDALSEESSFSAVLGTSSAMRRLFTKLPKVAAADATVMLTGETGTGKSLIARTIHDASPRRTGPFVVIDCGAIPPSLIESELFGHVQGAFTGAHRDRLGAFRAAAGGTVLLEEVGELPLDLQPKLLRALEEREVTPVGEDRSFPLDVRILAATHRDLRERVNAGQFRSDLFYRLDVVSLRVPALRERPRDIAILTDHFHRELTGTAAPEELTAAFSARAWPGNVRELRAAVERALILDEIDPSHVDASTPAAPTEIDPTRSFREAKDAAIAGWEISYLRALVAQHRGNVSSAARAVRMDRNHLSDLLKRYAIDPRG